MLHRTDFSAHIWSCRTIPLVQDFPFPVRCDPQRQVGSGRFRITGHLPGSGPQADEPLSCGSPGLPSRADFWTMLVIPAAVLAILLSMTVGRWIRCDFTARAKTALEQSLREALQLGHDYIGTEHILLGLTREDDGVAAQVLIRLGADLTRVRQQVIRLVRATGPEQARSDAPPGPATAAGVQARLDAVERRLAAL